MGLRRRGLNAEQIAHGLHISLVTVSRFEAASIMACSSAAAVAALS
jgi:hypothetical protein